MKKVLLFMVALCMVVGLCACGGKKTQTKEELLEQAERVEISEIESAVFSNKAKAKELYCGKTLEITNCYVWQVEEDYVILCGKDPSNTQIYAYLPTEELIKLEPNQCIDVVGVTEKDIKEVTEEIVMSFTFEVVTLNNAFVTK